MLENRVIHLNMTFKRAIRRVNHAIKISNKH
jgi:hypothetical protein